MERVAEKTLRGENGHRRVLRNARGQEIETLALTPSRNGADLTLSMSRPIEYAAFEALKAAVQCTDARSGSAIAVTLGRDPRDVQWPSYGLNERAAWRCATAQ
ncbi:hypothetical protein [Caballeronia arvi]|uniref:hypothetical protein n=1 Tax=Caballeronia arvi TaxID=1777135 RepID=UPI003898E555